MKRRLAQIAAVLAIVAALVYIVRPAGHVPLYDANLVRLAETQLQGYCAGEVFWETQGMGDAAKTAACRDERADTMSNKVNIVAAESAFCQALIDGGLQMPVADCLTIMSDNQYWPTYDGGISQDWNNARPYPKSAIQVEKPADDDSRTGGRGHAPTRGQPTPPYTSPTETEPTETTETTTEGTTTETTETTTEETTTTTETTP